MNKAALIVIILSLYFSSSDAQEIRKIQKTFLETEYFFLHEDYQDALPFYLQLYKKFLDNANLAYRIGTCYLNIPDKKSLAIDYLEAASAKISSKHREGSIKETNAPVETLYYLGKAYLVNYKFEKAKEVFLRYSAMLDPDDSENREFITHEIEACNTAGGLISHPISYMKENLGKNFNDENSNYNPVISADGKSFAYMVSLKFYDAIMFSRMIDGKWTEPVNITPDLQLDGKIFLSCLSSDGKTLFLSMNDDDNSDIYISTFDGKNWSKATGAGKNINTAFWESHAFISEDGDKIIFSSDRPGGYGGLDLYLTRKVNGEWQPAVNLGPVVNDRFNEDRAFLINNGKTLFFSSQSHETIGGYDIFRSDLQADDSWSIPKNLGYPLNTPDDNMFFMPLEKGNAGYYPIYGEKDGMGKEDIYRIILN
jgi:tetratricopeptide (TPR) repeat protein